MELDNLNKEYKALLMRFFELGKQLTELEEEIGNVDRDIKLLRMKAREEGYVYDWNDPELLTWKIKKSE
jgi:hypothetical protein